MHEEPNEAHEQAGGDECHECHRDARQAAEAPVAHRRQVVHAERRERSDAFVLVADSLEVDVALVPEDEAADGRAKQADSQRRERVALAAGGVEAEEGHCEQREQAEGVVAGEEEDVEAAECDLLLAEVL